MQGGATLVDVREYGEMPEMNAYPHLRIPLSVLQDKMNDIPEGDVVFLCQSGIRSLKALALFRQQYPVKNAYSLKGGVSAL
ncbi:rhodanese-like domain-containing protein [Rhizosphaericola mali]|uniref:rhodanese-like domain-containing protein n=1 Tax=Rhizosphaericola mali TaxID=2545455 RepID=UPI002DD69921|nr:rhodanese-like domain-containing protein [Rhizosphaericola mali]